jgi:site-specific DNA-cytosine methylase
MKVLVGCEYSGRVRQAFRNRGHDAWSCDLLESEDNSPYHIIGDVRLLFNESWDLAIFHPPCTHLAVSGARYFKEKQDGRQQDALEFVRTLLNAPIERIALENPVSIISSQIRQPNQVIHPWQYGHDASKTTCLWLKNLNPLVPTNIIKKFRYSNQTESGQNNVPPGPNQWKERSRTYQGIAEAMAEQFTQEVNQSYFNF